jgi:hypothetical protein
MLWRANRSRQIGASVAEGPGLRRARQASVEAKGSRVRPQPANASRESRCRRSDARSDDTCRSVTDGRHPYVGTRRSVRATPRRQVDTRKSIPQVHTRGSVPAGWTRAGIRQPVLSQRAPPERQADAGVVVRSSWTTFGPSSVESGFSVS